MTIVEALKSGQLRVNNGSRHLVYIEGGYFIVCERKPAANTTIILETTDEEEAVAKLIAV